MGAYNLEVSILPLLMVAIPLLFGCLSLGIRRGKGKANGTIAVTGLALTAVVSIMILIEVGRGKVLTLWGQNFYVDGLSALMLVLSSGIGLAVALYSIPFIPTRIFDAGDSGRRLSTYYGQLMIFLAMMNWTCSTNNIVMLYLSLELTHPRYGLPRHLLR